MINENVANPTGNDKDFDDFLSGGYLKAANVNSPDDAFVVISSELVQDDDGKENLIFNLERNENEWKFQPNKTNLYMLKSLNFTKARDLIGKKLYFKKLNVNNPMTKQMVESLRIWKVD